LADYREHFAEIKAAGADVIAVSVDPPGTSEALRRDLHLPFTILCDTERTVVRQWDIYNPREKGGIAKPSVFVIDCDRRVRYSHLDSVVKRVPAAEIIGILRAASSAQPVRCKVYIPRPSDFLRAMRQQRRQ
jgi:peroxiredoxin